MSLITVNTSDTFEQWRVKTNNISAVVGDGDTITTTATNLVDAINELRSGSIQGTLTVADSEFKVQIDSEDAAELVLSSNGNLTISGNLIANVTGNSDTATTLQTSRNIAITGDASWDVTFNGSQNVTSTLALSASGVTAGTYTKVTVDAKGRVTSATSLSSSDVTTALGYTPWHPTNDGSGSGLDADLLDGFNSSVDVANNTVAVRDSSGNLNANVFNGVATSARYADLAEKYTTDKEYAPGTVMVIALGGDAECTQSFEVGQLSLGVVSTDPAYLMNSELSNGQAIALKGRVPVRVVGPIRKGDKIMSTPDGCAQAGEQNVIGQALETNLDPKEKLVECAII
jgi:phage-related tail fiber protein